MIIITKAELHKSNQKVEDILMFNGMEAKSPSVFKKQKYPLLEEIYGKRVKEIVNKEEVTNWDLILTYKEK